MYNLNEWKEQFLDKHVQSQNVKGADFLSSETVVIVSGPPELSTTSTLTNLVPIGLVQNVSVAQQKQLQQIFEVGSRKPFFIPGRTVISAGISRVLFDGPSLMYASYISSAKGGGSDEYAIPGYKRPTGGDNTEVPGSPTTGFEGTPMEDSTANSKVNTATLGTNKPSEFFINLASGFFNRPLGLGFILYDGEQQAYGGFYLEGCYIQSHQFNVSSQQTILVENISIRATALRPLDPASLFGTTVRGRNT